LIGVCLTPTLAVFQLYLGVSKIEFLCVYFNFIAYRSLYSRINFLHGFKIYCFIGAEISNENILYLFISDIFSYVTAEYI